MFKGDIWKRMRLIDVEKFIEEFPIRADKCDKENANEHFINGVESVLEALVNANTVLTPYTFCKWLAWYVVNTDDDALIVEQVCRKLVKMGFLKVEGDKYVWEEED